MSIQPDTRKGRRLPRQLQQFFWDVDLEQVDPRRHSEYIIARLLEHGDLPSIRWLLVTYTEGEIARVVMKSRQLSRRTANFWRLRLAIPEAEVYALNRSYVVDPEPFY